MTDSFCLGPKKTGWKLKQGKCPPSSPTLLCNARWGFWGGGRGERWPLRKRARHISHIGACLIPSQNKLTLIPLLRTNHVGDPLLKRECEGGGMNSRDSLPSSNLRPPSPRIQFDLEDSDVEMLYGLLQAERPGGGGREAEGFV